MLLQASPAELPRVCPSLPQAQCWQGCQDQRVPWQRALAAAEPHISDRTSLWKFLTGVGFTALQLSGCPLTWL